MSEMKLNYFNARGRAETARMLFKLAGKEFIDNRIEGEEWQKFKPSTPKGQMPVLEVDGKMVCESMAINRFVARECGLYGATNWEAAVIDMVLDGGNDVFVPMLEYVIKAKTEEEKAAAVEKMKKALEVLDKFVAQYKSGKFLLGEKASLGDVSLYGMAEGLRAAAELSLDDYPTLSGIAKEFEAIPAIAEWIKSRPVTKM